MMERRKACPDSERLSITNAAEAHAGLRDTIEGLQAENAQLKKALEFLAPKVDCALCPHRIGGCYRIEPECGRDVMAWAMEKSKC